MTCEFDAAMVDRDEAIELTDHRFDGRVRLWHRSAPLPGAAPAEFVAVCAEVSAKDMTAMLHDLLLDSAGGSSLPAFLNTLTADVRTGWNGIRTWSSFGRGVQLDAHHLGGAHVQLEWTLATQTGGRNTWRATTTVYLRGDEQLRSLTAAVHRFLRTSRLS